MYFEIMSLKFYIYLTALAAVCLAETITYISSEHPKILYFNPKYVAYSNFTSRRYGRDDPFYYVELHVSTIRPFDNDISADFVFYEFLTNRYRRSFVEMHFSFCDLIHKDEFFGATMKQGMLLHPCPYPPGEYHMYNMTIPVKNIPHNFPFRKGRILVNFTSTETRELIGSGRIDIEIKEFNPNKRKKNKKNNITYSA